MHRHGAGGPVPIAELARRREIPVQFLEQLFATLGRAGVLRSQRGVKGGYSFARPASELTMLEVFSDPSPPAAQARHGPVSQRAKGVFLDAAQAALRRSVRVGRVLGDWQLRVQDRLQGVDRFAFGDRDDFGAILAVLVV